MELHGLSRNGGVDCGCRSTCNNVDTTATLMHDLMAIAFQTPTIKKHQPAGTTQGGGIDSPSQTATERSFIGFASIAGNLTPLVDGISNNPLMVTR